MGRTLLPLLNPARCVVGGLGLLLILGLSGRRSLGALLGYRLGVLYERRLDMCRGKIVCDRTHVRLVPLTEGGGIDKDDSALDEGVRADKLVVRRIVNLQPASAQIPIAPQSHLTHHTDDPRLLRDMLRSPGKVARIQTQRPELGVSTPCAHGVDTLRAELSGGGLATELEFSLLAVVCALGTGCGTLVPGFTRDTCRVWMSIGRDWAMGYAYPS